MNEDLLKEVDRLSRCCAQRGEKLRLLRESLRETDWQNFLREHPEAEGWFSEDGVAI